MTKHSTLRFLSLVPAVLGIAVTGCNRAEQPTPAAQAVPITVAMEDCKVEGPAKITSDVSILRLLFAGPPKEQLVKRGTVEADGQKYSVYLPKTKSYSTTNTKADDPFENTSTLIYIDHNADGKLTGDEGWYADLPVRFGDQMFDVSEISADGSRIELKPSKSPLRGVIVGRACPAFSFKTPDGQVVNNDSVAGKTLILDIWSFT